MCNGVPKGFFKCTNEIRQGDPLSPYLFTIYMEYFSYLMSSKLNRGKIMPLIKNDPIITHLIYADDLLVFIQATTEGAKSMRSIFKKMEKHAGLQLNRGKTRVFFNKFCNNSAQILDILQLNEGQLPIKYLGVPLSVNYLKHNNCNQLLDRILHKTQGWESKFLSLAGRYELIKSVLYPMVSYWMQCFELPKKTVHKINQICKKFLWCGKKSKIPWETVTTPKEEGGLGLKKLSDISKNYTIKRIWNVLNNGTMCAKWMNNRYANKGSIWDCSFNNSHSSTWKNMLYMRKEAQKYIDRHIVDGRSTSLWFEPWLRGSTLMEKLGNEFAALNSNRNQKVNSIIVNDVWKPDAITHNRHICDEIRNIKLCNDRDNDYWLCNNTKDGQFNFKQMWNSIRVKQNECMWKTIIWHKVATPKLNVCLYRAYNIFLPTKSKLMHQGFLNCNKCVLCNIDEETNTHLFFECKFTTYVWCWVRVKMKRPITQNDNEIKIMDEVQYILNNFRHEELIKEIYVAALSCAVWQVWKERNCRIFSNEQSSELQVCERIEKQVAELIHYGSRSTGKDLEQTKEILDNWNIKLEIDRIHTCNLPIPNPIPRPYKSSKGLVEQAVDEADAAKGEESTVRGGSRLEEEERRRRFEPP